MFYRRKDCFESLVSCAVMSLALVQPALAAEDSADSAIDEIVGEWDLAGTDTTIEIREDHLVFHSRLGQGDIRHENVHYFTVEYRQHHLECYYQIKRYGEDELSIVVARLPADQNCDLGMMRRSPGNVKARLEQARAQAEEKAKKEEQAKKEEKENQAGPLRQQNGLAPNGAAVAPTPAPSAAQGPKPTTVFKDCPSCPDMVVVPAGEFLMGSPENEPGRFTDEEPTHVVHIPALFAVGRYAITRDEFNAFVLATGYSVGGDCQKAELVNGKENFIRVPEASFRDPPVFTQQGNHPVVCVSWRDADEYVKWLSRHTNKEYRLLSEAEREYIARAGSTSAFPWGSDASPEMANYNWQVVSGRRLGGPPDSGAPALKAKPGTADTHKGSSLALQGTVAVTAYRPNSWGLFNTHGNVREWVQDCWNKTYIGAPSDGAAALTGDCSKRVVRGGSWIDEAKDTRSAFRDWGQLDQRYYHTGFRVARAL